MKSKIRYCTRTHKGLKKHTNEDSLVVIPDIAIGGGMARGSATLFAIADGMSGHVGGHKASRIATEFIKNHYADRLGKGYKNFHRQNDKNLKALETLILNIHEKIFAISDKIKRYQYMGTTCTVLLLYEMTAFLAYVGDTRIYLFRNDHLVQLTHDDTIAQLSVEMGYMSPEKASKHPLRHALTQALGQGVDEVHVRALDLKSGDVLVMCSDGLYEMIKDDEIMECLRKGVLGKDPCHVLVEKALARGGIDNITVIVVEVL